MANTLVVGGTGFIGSHLVQKLQANGEKITVLSFKRSEPLYGSWNSEIKLISQDLREASKLKSVLKNEAFDTVFNMGGYIEHTPFFKGGRTVFNQHFDGTLNLLESLDRSKLKAFVQIGSSDEYGGAPSPQSEGLREAPISSYSLGKAAAAQMLQMLYRTEKFPAVILRLFLTYGPGQDEGRFLPQIAKKCLANESFPTSEGKQIRDFCYVGDVVDAMLKAAKTEASFGEVINIASGIPISIKEVISKVVSLCGGGSPEFGKFPYRIGENMSLYADIKKAKSVLGWAPTTSMEAGLKALVEDFKARAAANP